jgi:hypothetical protein
MKTSPLQLDTPEYPVVEMRAHPHDDQDVLLKTLPVSVDCFTTYDGDGKHFSMVVIQQNDEAFAYTFDIRVFTTFSVDVAACKENYKSSFNPAVVAVNVARILYSGARELLATVSCRAPHGAAILPSVMIEPKDVEISFEDGKRDHILKEYFCFTDEMLSEVNAAMAANEAKVKQSKPKSLSKPSAKKTTATNPR